MHISWLSKNWCIDQGFVLKETLLLKLVQEGGKNHHRQLHGLTRYFRYMKMPFTCWVFKKQFLKIYSTPPLWPGSTCQSCDTVVAVENHHVQKVASQTACCKLNQQDGSSVSALPQIVSLVKGFFTEHVIECHQAPSIILIFGQTRDSLHES